MEALCIKEEKFNAISHLIGMLLALCGLIILLYKNDNESVISIFAIIVYSFTLISMMGVSAAYHFVNRPAIKHKLRVLDHINIYFLIAGTYTPVTLLLLNDGNGLLIFWIVWGIAFVGAIFKLFYTGKLEYLSLLLYIIMGWLIVLDISNLTNIMSSMGLWLLFLGGLFYTFGILFYAIDKIPFNHFIWHLFVLAGAISHWLVMFIDVV